MPILVQWKWDERYRNFLVIFHFDNDLSQSNLRTERKILNRRDSGGSYQYIPENRLRKMDNYVNKLRNVLTWAPSHIETALLSQVLSYANIINGLPEWRKKQLLKSAIFGNFFGFEEYFEYWDNMDKPVPQAFTELVGVLGDRKWAWILEEARGQREPRVSVLVELCLEYVDYIWDILRELLREN